VFRTVAVGVAKALNFLHSQPEPILFRDLKPSNILVISCPMLQFQLIGKFDHTFLKIEISKCILFVSVIEYI